MGKNANLWTFLQCSIQYALSILQNILYPILFCPSSRRYFQGHVKTTVWDVRCIDSRIFEILYTMDDFLWITFMMLPSFLKLKSSRNGTIVVIKKEASALFKIVHFLMESYSFNILEKVSLYSCSWKPTASPTRRHEAEGFSVGLLKCASLYWRAMIAQQRTRRAKVRGEARSFMCKVSLAFVTCQEWFLLFSLGIWVWWESTTWGDWGCSCVSLKFCDVLQESTEGQCVFEMLLLCLLPCLCWEKCWQTYISVY